MADERPKLAASEIESVLRAALQKLPSLRGVKFVRIRPYSGPGRWARSSRKWSLSSSSLQT
jgi:hypothetical protein